VRHLRDHLYFHLLLPLSCNQFPLIPINSRIPYPNTDWNSWAIQCSISKQLPHWLAKSALGCSSPLIWTMAVLGKLFCQAHETMYLVTWSRAGQRCNWICLEGEFGQVDLGAREMPYHYLSTTWFSCIFKLSFKAKLTGSKWKPEPSISQYGHSICF